MCVTLPRLDSKVNTASSPRQPDQPDQRLHNGGAGERAIG